MNNGFRPIGAALPPRRDLVAAASATPPRFDGADSIIVPEARDRMLELIEREQLPTDVRSTLAGALTGDLRRQQLLFQAMIDTWPRLQKALAEVKRAARKAPWRVLAWAPRGEQPDSAAETLAREVENTIWGMRPDPIRGEKGLEGTIEELVMGYYLGHQVLEVHWERGDGWQPRATKVVPPRFYSYPYDQMGEDRLMLDRTGSMIGWNALEDFPPHRFLVAANGGHPGHASIAAPLRALTGYWLAAVYGLKWLLQFAQVCGVPIRWAEYGSEPDRKKVAEMLQNIGTAGWGAFPAGTKLNFVETSKSAEQVPQKVLVDLADEQCDIFILGQTLTSSAGDRGSQALGTVHEGVRKDVIAGVCDFVGEVLSYQLAPSIIAVNHGKERKDIPGIWVEWPETKDEKGLAERDVALGIVDGSVPVARAWFYERHGIPIPSEGEELLVADQSGGDGDFLNDDNEDDEEDFEEDEDDEEDFEEDEEEIEASSGLIEAKAGKKKKRKKLPRGNSHVPTGSGNGFDPNQKRDPGGRWVDTGKVAKSARAKRGEMRDGTPEDMKRLRIPPNATNVKVAVDADSEVLATYNQANGKPRPVYSPEYIKGNAGAKFGRIAALDKEMPKLQSRITADMDSGGPDAHQAMTLRLITLTGLRNGGKEGGGKVEAFGASSLLTKHARVEGDAVHLDFIGKEGIRQRHSFRDPKIAAHIKSRQADGKETIFDGSADKTLGYLKKISGDKFKVHDFRTHHGTVLADAAIQKIAKKGQLPTTKEEFDAFQTRVSLVVSRRLGNGQKMALENYIHPAVWDGY